MKNVIQSITLFSILMLYGPLSAQFNYGEALQKSLFFYEVQQSGELPSWNRVTWRADSALNDGADVGLDLTGGWYDAGDHVKFGFPMAFSVTSLAWGAIEYEDAYKRSGQYEILRRNLRYVTDYFIKCHTAPNEFYGQVGDGGLDHAFWGSPEVMVMPRPSHKIDANNPGSDLASETAAAMAAVSILFKDDDPSYSATLLEHAKQLYDFADNFRGEYSNSITDAAGFYRSFSSYQDEIVWGAIWLYKATNDVAYLDKAETEYDNLGNEGQSNDKAYKFTMSWDDKSYGSYVLLADITGKDRYKNDSERFLDFWTSGVNGDRVTYSPGGQAHLIQWGSLRYAANTSFLAFVYSDKVATSAANKAKYHDFAVGQTNYALGDNPINRSFMIGFGNNPANNSHHRSAHGAWANNLANNPDQPSHTLFGALVGGPSSPDDSFVDDRGDFIANEVACDYNACFTGNLVRMYDEFGGNPLANFPVQETPTRAEIRSVSKFNSNNNSGSTVQIRIQNRTAWPARVTDKLSYRYFFDISEGVAQGLTIADYQPTLNSVQGSSSVTIEAWDASENIYYAEVSLTGEQISPIGDPQFRRETQLNFRVANGVPYDTTNDWSAQGLGGTELESVNIPVYDNGQLVFGIEPDGGILTHKADFNATPTSGIAPLSVSFDASATTNPNNENLTYTWNFGDGTTGTGVTDTHVYTAIGSYTATLSVSNGTITSTSTETITVSDGSPIAAFTADKNIGAAPLVVNFDAGSSVDPTGGSLTYSWDFGNGETASTAIASTTYTAIDTYVVTLTVTNSTGETDTNSQSIVVNDGSVSCAFGTPTAEALPSINSAFDNIFVLGNGGPDLSNVTNFTINWDLNNNGLYQFSMNTTNGFPSFWNDFLPIITSNFNSVQPDITIANSGFPGLDGDYWATVDTGNFVLVSKTGGYTIYFSTSTTAPDCGAISTPTVAGGTLTGGPFAFNVGDGIADNVSGIVLAGNIGEVSQWIVTDDAGNILGLPPTSEAVNFDGAGAGSCFIYNVSYNGTLTGLAQDENIANLDGDFDLSNSIEVVRTLVIPSVNGGILTGGPYAFTVGDGIADNVSGIVLTGNDGAENQWVVTDDSGNILGLPPTPEAVNFDGAGAGTCFIYHVSYNGTITGLAQDENIADLEGDFGISNGIEVARTLESTGSDCTFGTPNTDALPSINSAFENIFVLGNGGPDLSNVTNFTINWDLNNDGLYQFSMNTSNGVPAYWNDFLPNLAQGFNSAQPDVTISNSGFTGLDGDYWATIDAGNFVLVSKAGGFTIYFSTSSTAPDCDGGNTNTNTDPIAAFSATPISGTAPLVVTFDASASTDPDGDAITYAWDFGDGNTATGETAENTYNSVGDYDATLTVTDENGAESQDTITIRVNDDIIIIDPPVTDNEYINRFNEMRQEFYDPDNGYFSADGSPHHSIESLIVEAPDHGHESTSELYSYWLWLEVMNGRINKDWAPLAEVWDRIEEFIIPTNADQPTNAAYDPSSPAAYAPEFPLPSDYPSPLGFTAPVGVDPVSPDLTATYGADIYQMHWLLDNDNFYGYGNRGDGVSTPSYINTFQRGEQESVYETIPHPSWESFEWGGPDGFLPIFILDENYSEQWRYTSAPDADARVVQAMYWAQIYAKEQGISLNNLDLDKTVKMGDFLRLSMFDKYFKPLGVQSDTSGAGTGYDSAHYLMSWYMSWGGAADTSAPWAFRISSSHCHFGYQNPVAAYALTNVDELKPISQNGERDWNVSLTRQMEFYTWLQSKEGAIAGGATNSWNGDYSPYPTGKSTFYDMAYDKDPVYHDPGSGTWFGWQAWSMERVAEYYYITNDPMAKQLMDKWADWVKSEVNLIGEDDFEIPATLEWSGEPDTWDADNPGANNNLSVTVTNYNKDLGIAASMAKALIYYAAATEKHDVLDTDSRDLAKEVLDRMWVTYRDDKGVSSPEERGDFVRMFEEEVYVPDGFIGAMPNGDEIKPGVTFLDIRSGYRDDPDFDRLEAAYNAGEDYTQNYHRSWAQIEVALANAEYGFFFGEDNTATGVKTITSLTIEVSPNPASDFINVSISNNTLSLSKNSGTDIRLIDLAGNIVHSSNMENSTNMETQIPVDSFASGLYLLEINNNSTGKTHVEKVLID